MNINLWLAISLIILLELIVPTILCLTLKNKPLSLKVCTIILAVLFFAFLFVGTTAEVTLKNNIIKVNYVFTDSWFDFKIKFGSTSISNIMVNIVLLFPVSYIVFVFSKTNYFAKCIFFAFVVSLIIETYQWVLPIPRGTEIIDLILNTLCGVVSYLYCKLLKRFGAFKK